LHIIQTTASIPTKYYTVIKTTKCPLRVDRTHASQIQDGGQPPSWKNRKIAINQQRFDRFGTKFGMAMQFGHLERLTVKISKI